MGEPLVVIWDGIEAPSEERCTIVDLEEKRIAGVVRGEFGTCTYAMTVSQEWWFRSLRVTLDHRSLTVSRSGDVWTVDGEERPDLSEAREIDVSISPISNTLPIRRLDLDPDASADIVTAYVRVPELTVTADPQRYTRTGDREYRYDSRDTDFTRFVTVDEHGLVIEYPGLFRRRKRPGVDR